MARVTSRCRSKHCIASWNLPGDDKSNPGILVLAPRPAIHPCLYGVSRAACHMRQRDAVGPTSRLHCPLILAASGQRTSLQRHFPQDWPGVLALQQGPCEGNQQCVHLKAVSYWFEQAPIHQDPGNRFRILPLPARLHSEEVKRGRLGSVYS